MTDNKFKHGVIQTLGHISCDSGGLLITDQMWESQLPKVFSQMYSDNYDIAGTKIPIKGTLVNGQRVLMIYLDEPVTESKTNDLVRVEEEEVTHPAEEDD